MSKHRRTYVLTIIELFSYKNRAVFLQSLSSFLQILLIGGTAPSPYQSELTIVTI